MTLPLTDGQLADRHGDLTTTGRVSGKPHEIEIWFGVADDRRTLYLLSGGGDRADWVRNIDRDGAVTFRISGITYTATARRATSDEDRAARESLAAKYYAWSSGELPNDWSRTALPVIVSLEA